MKKGSSTKSKNFTNCIQCYLSAEDYVIATISCVRKNSKTFLVRSVKLGSVNDSFKNVKKEHMSCKAFN